MTDRGDERFVSHSEPSPEDSAADVPPGEQTPHSQQPHDPRGSEWAPGWFEFQQPEPPAERLSREDPEYGQEPAPTQDPAYAQSPSYSQDPETSQEQPAHGHDAGGYGRGNQDDAEGRRSGDGRNAEHGREGSRGEGPEYGQPTDYHGQQGWFEQQEGYQPGHATARDKNLDYQDSGQPAPGHRGVDSRSAGHRDASHMHPGQQKASQTRLPTMWILAVVVIVVIVAVILLTGAAPAHLG